MKTGRRRRMGGIYLYIPPTWRAGNVLNFNALARSGGFALGGLYLNRA